MQQRSDKTSARLDLLASLKRTALSGHFVAMLFVRGSGLLLQILLQLLLGRFFGPATLGIYQVYSSWTATLGEAAAQGQPTKSMKLLSVSGWGQKAKSEFSTSLYSILVFSGLVSVALVVTYILILAPLWPSFFGLSENTTIISIVLLLVPSCLAFACLRLVSESMKALGKTVLGIFLDTVTLPLIVILAVAVLLFREETLSDLQLLYIPALVLVGVATVSILFVLKGFRGFSIRKDSSLSPIHTSDESARSTSVSPSETRAFWGTGVLSIFFLSAPFMLMPLYASMDDVGYFSVAFKLINLISTILILLAGLYGPRFARAFHDGNTKKLWRGLKETQIISLALYLPFIALLFLFAKPVLAVFGADFVNSQSLAFLGILAVGQLINAATGLPSILLNMSGAANQELSITLVSLVIFIFLALVLGPQYEGVGVAVAFTVGMTCKNCAAYIAVWFLLSNKNTADKTEYAR